MARASSSRVAKSGNKPDERPFSKVAPPVAVMDNYQRVSSNEVIARLKGLARGWDAELESLLSMPPTLFMSHGGVSQYYSSDANFSISDVLMCLSMGAKPDTSRMTFGIALHERAGTTYFVLADPERRIIVRQRISCLHSDPPELDWGPLKGAIQSAIAGASREEAKKEGLVAIYDGSLRFASPPSNDLEKIGSPWSPPVEKK